MTSQTGQQITAMHILPNISWSKGNQTMPFGQLMECKMGNDNYNISSSQRIPCERYSRQYYYHQK